MGKREVCEHQPKAVVKWQSNDIMGFICPDNVIEARRSKFIVLGKENSKCLIIDFAVQYDT